jgi:hypothetical protein
MMMMDSSFKEKFLELWGSYFDQAELPIILYYVDEKNVRENDLKTTSGCLIS